MAVQRIALELRAEIMAEVVADEIGAVGVIAVEAQQPAEGIVNRGVEGTGDDQGAQPRDRFRQLQLPGRLGRLLEVLRFQCVADVERMARYGAAGEDPADAFRQRLHGGDGGVVAEYLRRERPDVAQRHRAMSDGAPAIPAADPALDVEERDAIDGGAAELDRRTIEMVFVLAADGFDADVGRLHGGLTVLTLVA